MMDWDAAGAIGEIVGATAVVISVVYLAVQVRRQTEQSRLGAGRELMLVFTEKLDRISQDPEFADLWIRAVNNFESLPNNERLRIASFYQGLMRLFEQQSLHINKGNIDPAFFESMNLLYSEWIQFPGTRQWWASSKNLFEKSFRERVDREMEAVEKVGYESTFQTEHESST